MDIWCLILHIVCFLTGSSVEGLDFVCLEAYSCLGDDLIVSGFLKCHGLASCAHTYIDNTDNGGPGATTACWGKRACQSSIELLGTVRYPADIRGFLGLAWTNDTNTSTFGCQGEASCFEIKHLTSDDYLGCSGLRSCQNIAVHDYSNVLFSPMMGFLSLHNGIVYNPSNLLLKAFFAGFNATIYCESGNTCDIYCYVNGCENLSLFCDNDATCNVYNCDDSEGIICPNGWNGTSYEYTIENSSNYDRLMLINDIFVTSNGNEYILNDSIYIEDIYSNNECDSDSNSNDYECNDYTGSCQNVNYNNKNVNNICCNAYESCYSMTAKNGFNNIYCNSGEGCSSMSVKGNSDLSSNIYARGRWSIEKGSIYNFNNIFGSGDTCMKYSKIGNGKNVGCFGYESCHSTVIKNVTNIFSVGHNALKNATIISDTAGGTNEMNVYILGYNEWDCGESSIINILCSDGDTCNLYCLTNDTCDMHVTISCVSQTAADTCTINTYMYNATKSCTNAPTNSPASNTISILIYIAVAIIIIIIIISIIRIVIKRNNNNNHNNNNNNVNKNSCCMNRHKNQEANAPLCNNIRNNSISTEDSEGSEDSEDSWPNQPKNTMSGEWR